MYNTKPTDFAKLLTDYLSKYLPGQLGASTNTIISYRDTFSLLIKFLKDRKNIAPERITVQTFNRTLIEEFLYWMENDRKNSISTRNQRLAAIHALFKYMQVETPQHMQLCQNILTIPIKRKPSARVNHLSLEGIKAILSQPNLATSNGRRDLTLLSLLYDTGARVQELADIKLGDVRLTEPATIKLTGKGSKSRIVPLMSKTAKLLKDYIEARKLDSIEMRDYPLFYNRFNHKLTREGIAYILSKYVKQALIVSPEHLPKTITPHCLRHSKAMHLLQAGVNLVYIRDILGHVDIKTTEIYARADSDMKRKALEVAYQSVTPPNIPSWKEDNSLLSWLQSLGKLN